MVETVKGIHTGIVTFRVGMNFSHDTLEIVIDRSAALSISRGRRLGVLLSISGQANV